MIISELFKFLSAILLLGYYWVFTIFAHQTNILKMQRIFLLIFLISTIFPDNANSQNPYPQNYFRSPIDFRILLSGTFGELRSDHFHTGIDIKTRQVEGASVYAAADGYVSRIKISAFSYGKTIYLTHPNGYVTVYAHLSKIDDKLAGYVKNQQYKRKSFEVDLYLNKNQFEFAKGDLIAFSGNSGGSEGPHLHFEIRDEKTQEPLNPILFGIEVKDNIRPIIQSIRVYPIGKKPFNLELKGGGKNYYLNIGDTIGLSKNFYLGINTIDKQNDSNNNNGVFEVELFVDSLKVYGNRQERLDFSTGRYINSFIDYAYYSNYKRRYQRSYIGQHNELKIYTDVQNNGVIQLSDSGFHKISYQVKDAAGNASVLKFYAYAADIDTIETIAPDTIKKAVFYVEQENIFETEKMKLFLPSNSLYDSLYFHSDILASDSNGYTPIYQIHKKDVPLHKYIKISIKADSIPKTMKSKLLIARIEDKNYSTSTTIWEGSWATASIRSFGDYTIVADTIKPQIKMLNSSKNSVLEKGFKLSFIIKDELSGIKDYNGYLNNEWVLFEYDAKNDLLFHYIESERLLDENKLKMEVVDRVGNTSVFERTFRKQ